MRYLKLNNPFNGSHDQVKIRVLGQTSANVHCVLERRHVLCRCALSLFLLPFIAAISHGQVTNPGTSFNYTINAYGSQTITTYPDQSFSWNVTATATETWTYSTIANQSETHYVGSTGIPFSFGPSANGTATVNYQLFVGSGGNVTLYVAGTGVRTATANTSGSYSLSVLAGHTYSVVVNGNSATFGYVAIITVTYPVLQYVTTSAPVSASKSGSGIVNANEGSKLLGSVNLPTPQHGGTLGSVTFTTTSSNSRVNVYVNNNNVYAQTSYSTTQTQPWSAQQTGSATVAASDGEKLITNSPLVAPDGNTTWSVTVDSALVAPLMIGSQFFAHYIMPPLVVTALQPGASGVAISFNRAINSSVLSIYGTNGITDFTITGSTSGPVAGSLIIGAQSTNVTFLKTGLPLAPDTYTVTLVSATNGFTDYCEKS